MGRQTRPPLSSGPLEEMSHLEYALSGRVLRATIHLTNRCNLKCPHCGLSSGPAPDESPIPLDRLAHIIEALEHYGIPNLDLTGGEIFLRPDLFDILELARGTRLNLGLLTNGTLVTRDIARRLGHYPVHTVKISFDGLEETHDAVRGRGAFAKAVAAVDHVRDETTAGVKAMVTLTPDNCGDIGRLVSLLADLGVWRCVLRPCVATGRAGRRLVPNERDIWLAYRGLLAAADQLRADLLEWVGPNPYPRLDIWANSPYTLVEESGRHITILTDGTTLIDFCRGQAPDNVVGNALQDDPADMLARVEKLVAQDLVAAAPLLLDKALDWCCFDLSPESPDFGRRPCPVCGGEEEQVLSRVVLRKAADQPGAGEAAKELAMVRCPRDGACRTQPAVRPEAAARMYADPAYFGEGRAWIATGDLHSWRQLARFGYGSRADRGELSPSADRHLRHFLGKGVPQAGDRVLDIGAGMGEFLSGLCERGWPRQQLHAFEVSPPAAGALQAKGLSVTCGDLGATLPYGTGSFDAAVILDVLEHSYDPPALLREAHRVLGPSGHLLLAVPLCPPGGPLCVRSLEHVVYLPSPTLKALLTGGGFRVVDWDELKVKYGPDGWITFTRVIARPDRG